MSLLILSALQALNERLLKWDCDRQQRYNLLTEAASDWKRILTNKKSIQELTKRIDKQTYLGTAVVFFAAINLAKLPPYILLGHFSLENILLASVFFPVAFLGIKFGVLLQKMINEALFFKIIHTFLVLLGLYLVALG